MLSAGAREGRELGAPSREPSPGVRQGRGPDDRAPARGGGRQARQSARQERRQSWPGPVSDLYWTRPDRIVSLRSYGKGFLNFYKDSPYFY